MLHQIKSSNWLFTAVCYVIASKESISMNQSFEGSLVNFICEAKSATKQDVLIKKKSSSKIEQ